MGKNSKLIFQPNSMLQMNWVIMYNGKLWFKKMEELWALSSYTQSY